MIDWWWLLAVVLLDLLDLALTWHTRRFITRRCDALSQRLDAQRGRLDLQDERIGKLERQCRGMQEL